jgi:RIO kinase 2
MKLDPTVMRTMDRKDFRVLEAVEKGMRSHGLVPGPLVATIANLRHGGTGKIMSSLLRDKLLSHESKKGGYDGYRLTNAGYDILALHNLKTRGFVAALGDRIGTGKESDVYLAVSKDGAQHVLKFHRLGRTSFRNVRKKRDYFSAKKLHQQPNSWLFLSRLSAIKEFAFMKALHGVGYPTPSPVAHNRHVVVMSLVRGVPLYQIIPNRISPEQAESIFLQATDMAVRLAKHGLVHCDLNEFNLLVDMSGIQSTVAEGDDTYVRHSGMSVAPSKGALSGIGVWDKLHDAEKNLTGDANSVEESIPEPLELLENGEPKPVVTLIDFPQMVSTQHPNAKELYDRDLECLRRFFVMKLQCRIPEEDLTSHIVQWETLLESAEEQQEEGQKDSEDNKTNESTSGHLQVRLDVELKASGYSAEDSKRDLELFYYESDQKLIHSTLEECSEEEDDEDGEGTSDEDADHQAANIDQGERGVDEEDPNFQQEDNERDFGDESSNSEDEDGPEVENLLVNNPIDALEREKLEEKAKARVRRQLEEQKKKGQRKGAFRSRNSNKSYVKGKRVMQDFAI